MKRWKWIAYLFASLLILAVVSAKIVRAEAAYRLGKSYRFPVQTYDPRDPFRGRYLALQMESVARSSDIPGGRTSGPLSCCVSIVVDEKGKARFDHLSLEPPESGDWLNVDLRRFRGTRNSFRPPFERFYLNEKLAPEAERILMDAFANGEAELVVRVYRGFGCVEDLLVDGVPIRELAKKRLTSAASTRE